MAMTSEQPEDDNDKMSRVTPSCCCLTVEKDECCSSIDLGIKDSSYNREFTIRNMLIRKKKMVNLTCFKDG